MNLRHPQLPKTPDQVLLLCNNKHEHLCGDVQVDAILRDPCPWCGSPLHRAAWFDAGGTLQKTLFVDARRAEGR